MSGVHRLEYRVADGSPANRYLGGVTTMSHSSLSGPARFSGKGVAKRSSDKSNPETYAFLGMSAGRKQQKGPSLTLPLPLARPFRYPRVASTKGDCRPNKRQKMAQAYDPQAAVGYTDPGSRLCMTQQAVACRGGGWPFASERRCGARMLAYPEANMVKTWCLLVLRSSLLFWQANAAGVATPQYD